MAEEQFYEKLADAAEISALIASVIETQAPGSYDFSSTYTKSWLRWSDIAKSFRSHPVREVSRLGKIMRELIRQMDEADIMARAYGLQSRKARRAHAELIKLCGKLAGAAERMRRPILAGVL